MRRTKTSINAQYEGQHKSVQYEIKGKDVLYLMQYKYTQYEYIQTKYYSLYILFNGINLHRRVYFHQ